MSCSHTLAIWQFVARITTCATAGCETKCVAISTYSCALSSRAVNIKPRITLSAQVIYHFFAVSICIFYYTRPIYDYSSIWTTCAVSCNVAISKTVSTYTCASFIKAVEEKSWQALGAGIVDDCFAVFVDNFEHACAIFYLASIVATCTSPVSKIISLAVVAYFFANSTYSIYEPPQIALFTRIVNYCFAVYIYNLFDTFPIRNKISIITTCAKSVR